MSIPVSLNRDLFALLSVLVIALIFGGKGPLHDSHWDAPIYLERSREIVETSAVYDYAGHASDIAARLASFKVEPDSSTPYWGFMRFGHTLILATATAWSGGGLAGIQAAFWLYTVIWAAAIVLTGLLAQRMVRLLAPDLPPMLVAGGAALSVVLYLASDVARYMSGNLVAEVPALLFLVTACYLLVLAQHRRSLALSISSGIVGFALYTTKMESVWAYVVFLPLFFWALHAGKNARPWWPGFLWAACCAMVLYGIYAWHFWPLGDPRLFLLFAAAHESQSVNPVAPFKLWFAAGGLVWLGVLVALVHARHQRVLWISLGWLGLITLPYLDSLIAGRPAQVRMFTLILPALMVASTLGLASLITTVRRSALRTLSLATWIACALGLAIISHGDTYRWLRDQPGGWRLQYVKAFLGPPPYERINYPVMELATMSDAIHRTGTKTVVFLAKDIPEEYLNIIAYLGPSPSRSAIDRYSDPAASFHHATCGARNISFENLPVFFCKAAPERNSLNSLATNGVRILQLAARTGADEDGQVVARTARLVLLNGY